MSTLCLWLDLNTRAKSVGTADIEATKEIRLIAQKWLDERVLPEKPVRNRLHRSLSKIAVQSRSPEPDESIAARWAWLHGCLLDAVDAEIDASDARREAAEALPQLDELLKTARAVA